MNKKLNPTLVGAFVVGALFLVVIGVIVFGSGRMFRQTYEFVLYFDGSVNGLPIGAPVKIKGVEIGAVMNILLSLDKAREDLKIPVIIEIDPKKLTRRGGTGAALTDPAAFDQLIQRGLRAQLAPDGYITGKLFISLDFHPESPLILAQSPGARYREIPTLPTTFEVIFSTLERVIDKLKEIDFDPFIKSATGTVEGLDRLINAPETKKLIQSLNKAVTDIGQLVKSVDAKVGPVSESIKEAANAAHGVLKSAEKLVQKVDVQVEPVVSSIDETLKSVRAAVARAEKTLESAEGTIAEGSPLRHHLNEALTELSAAARSIRILANYLERHPEALIHGKNSGRR